MRTTRSLVASTLAVSAAFLLAACAPLTQQQREALEYRRVEYEEQFRAFRSQCAAEGGRIVIFAAGEIGRDGIPNVGDRYHCA